MDLAKLYRDHFQTIYKQHQTILDESGYGSMVIDAGTAYTYFNDDMHAAFRPNPYFSYFCPVRSAEHMIVINENTPKPQLIFFHPDDFWHEQTPFEASFWGEHFEVKVVKTSDEVIKNCTPSGRACYIGENKDLAARLGWEAMPTNVVAMIDWDRSFKTDYEVACAVEATRLAAAGHKNVAHLAKEGTSEIELHYAYTKGAQCTDDALPYQTIIGWDQKAAVLHYHAKRSETGNHVLLIDAGANFNGYASDITRTYSRPGKEHPIFEKLLSGMNKMQLSVCDAVKPGGSFLELTDLSHKGVAQLLLDTGIVKSGTVDELIDNEVTRAFYPHGLGHLLGLQVHDVGGSQMDKFGTPCQPPKRYPRMRTNRRLEPGMLITVEPGLYFIPLLIEELKEKKIDCDYSLIEELIPFGGIRIEDDVLVTATGHRNLTREFLP